jgi:hypothetical protein
MIHKTSPGVFRCGQPFQRGDLPIYVVDGVGNPMDPHRIRYSLSYHPKHEHNRDRHMVGPRERTPVKADLGEYYATGYSGEGGQPGQWYINWVIQEYFEGPLTIQEFGFIVYDTSEYHVPYCGHPGGHNQDEDWDRDWGVRHGWHYQCRGRGW